MKTEDAPQPSPDLVTEPDYFDLLPCPEVERMTGLKKPTIYKRIAADAFPRPRSLGPNCVRWYRGAVRDWCRSQPESIEGGPNGSSAGLPVNPPRSAYRRVAS